MFQGPPGTPNLIRWVGNERGVAPYPCWSTTDPGTAEDGTEESVFAGRPNAPLWMPGECDVPIRNHEWFWTPNDEGKIYPLAELMEMYYCSVGHNCNLLLNANPGPDGQVPEADFKRYEEFGQEIQRRFSSALASTAGEGVLVDLDLKCSQRVNHVVLMEDITQGERVLAYVVEGWSYGDTWRTLCSGQCVGHKRIQQFDTVETARIRLRITQSKATPQLRWFAAYFVA